MFSLKRYHFKAHVNRQSSVGAVKNRVWPQNSTLSFFGGGWGENDSFDFVVDRTTSIALDEPAVPGRKVSLPGHLAKVSILNLIFLSRTPILFVHLDSYLIVYDCLFIFFPYQTVSSLIQQFHRRICSRSPSWTDEPMAAKPGGSWRLVLLAMETAELWLQRGHAKDQSRGSSGAERHGPLVETDDPMW